MTSHAFSVASERVKQIRNALPASARERSRAKGLAYFIGSFAAYWASFVAIAMPAQWPTRIAFALLNGVAVAVVFIVGHDACHGSLTPSSQLNKWVGRLAFLPSLHPYASWEYSHNALHHGWTNLRGKDPVYCPRSVDEYRALSTRRQWFERFSRTWLGLLPLYLVDIWWSLEMAPNAHHRAHIEKRGTFAFDRALVAAFPIVQAVVAALVLRVRGIGLAPGTGVIALAVVLPFLAFNWLIGFATFQHHTHPRIIWYVDSTRWSFFRSQVQGTVHVVFPRWIELLLHNIMEHTAHHVDTKVPLYNLTGAQDAIEAAYGEDNVIVEPFSFAGLARTFRTCQLYDFDTYQWLTFDGAPTTEPRVLEQEVAAQWP